MAIGVRVVEYSGAVVGRLEAPVDVNRLCAVAAGDPARYPLLAGVDKYDHTYFNSRQSMVLVQELEALAAATSDVGLAAEAVRQLAELLRPARGRPHHRQLVFVGDQGGMTRTPERHLDRGPTLLGRPTVARWKPFGAPHRGQVEHRPRLHRVARCGDFLFEKRRS
ncbi:hypothetical protein [Actinocatenispora thailandica]|uniref:hypothetical protein n=1 Tax=Actinocatenispora thailandica TaxID=227318 RepID=UPI001950DB1D|nr:hypothetical protein [Actinocatenispora thailandica]